MLQEKKKTGKKKNLCGICTDVKVKLIKTRQRDYGLVGVFTFFLVKGCLKALRTPDIIAVCL